MLQATTTCASLGEVLTHDEEDTDKWCEEKEEEHASWRVEEDIHFITHAARGDPLKQRRSHHKAVRAIEHKLTAHNHTIATTMYHGALRSGNRYTDFVRAQTGGELRRPTTSGTNADTGCFLRLRCGRAFSLPTQEATTSHLVSAGLPLPTAWLDGFDGERPVAHQKLLQFESKEDAHHVWKHRAGVGLPQATLLRVKVRRQKHRGVGRWPSQRAIADDVAQAVARGDILLGESMTSPDQVLVLLPTGDTVDGTRSVQLTWESEEEMLPAHFLFENVPGIETWLFFVLQHRYSTVATFHSREQAAAARQQLAEQCAHVRLLRAPVITVNYGSLDGLLSKLIGDAVQASWRR